MQKGYFGQTLAQILSNSESPVDCVVPEYIHQAIVHVCPIPSDQTDAAHSGEEVVATTTIPVEATPS